MIDQKFTLITLLLSIGKYCFLRVKRATWEQ